MKHDFQSIYKQALRSYMVRNVATDQSLFKNLFYKGDCADTFEAGTVLNILEFKDGNRNIAICMNFTDIAENGQPLNDVEAFITHYRYLGYTHFKRYMLTIK